MEKYYTIPLYVQVKKTVIPNTDYDYRLSNYLKELQSYYKPNVNKPKLLVEYLNTETKSEFFLTNKIILCRELFTNFIFESRYVVGLTPSALQELDRSPIGFYDDYTNDELVKLISRLEYVFYRRGVKPIEVNNQDDAVDKYIKKLKR